MKTLLFSITLLMLLSSCDVSGIFGEETIPVKQNQPTKQNSNQQPVYLQKKDTSKITVVNFNDTPTKNSNSNSNLNNTLEKDIAAHKDDAEKERLQEQVDALKLRIQNINKQSNSTLVKSTYIVKHDVVVEKYLYELYVKELESLKASNRSESILSEKFKKFFTVEYCDDRVLEWLDEFADKKIRSDARRMRINFNKLEDEDATSKQIINYK